MEKPKIKTFKIFRQERSNEDKTLQLQRELDEKGNKLSELSYSEDGELMEEKYWEYDSNGALIADKCIFIEEEVTEVVKYLYDEQGKLTLTHKSYGEAGDADSTYYIYNDGGKLIEKRTESSEGEVEHKEEMKYDGENLIQQIVYNYDGTIMEKSSFTYNEKGELLEELRYTSERNQELKILYDYPLVGKSPDTTVYNSKGNIVQRTRNSFDDKQRIVKEVIETVDLTVKKFTSLYAYDSVDNLIEVKLVDKNENLLSKIEYKHNNFNLLSEEIHFEVVEEGVELRKFSTNCEYEYF